MYTCMIRIFGSTLANHPERNWSILLQQAWSLRLREWSGSVSNGNNSNSHTTNSGKKFDEPCRRYNKGRCPFGSGCRYEYRCSYCFKLGHAAINCRKLQADRDRERSRGNGRRDSDDHRHRDHQFNKKHNNNFDNHGHTHQKKIKDWLIIRT